jgi:hypothetical protein
VGAFVGPLVGAFVGAFVGALVGAKMGESGERIKHKHNTARQKTAFIVRWNLLVILQYSATARRHCTWLVASFVGGGDIEGALT